MSRHDSPEVLEALDMAWDDESGFLGMLRRGHFAKDAGDALLILLESIEVEKGERLHSDFVRLTWFVPLFTEWQLDRAVTQGADRHVVEKMCNNLRETVMKILGTP